MAHQKLQDLKISIVNNKLFNWVILIGKKPMWGLCTLVFFFTRISCFYLCSVMSCPLSNTQGSSQRSTAVFIYGNCPQHILVLDIQFILVSSSVLLLPQVMGSAIFKMIWSPVFWVLHYLFLLFFSHLKWDKQTVKNWVKVGGLFSSFCILIHAKVRVKRHGKFLSIFSPQIVCIPASAPFSLALYHLWICIYWC